MKLTRSQLSFTITSFLHGHVCGIIQHAPKFYGKRRVFNRAGCSGMMKSWKSVKEQEELQEELNTISVHKSAYGPLIENCP